MCRNWQIVECEQKGTFEMKSINPDKGRRRMRRGAVLLLGTGVFGFAVASAATLGGLDGQTLGADANTLVSCDTDGVTLAYTTSYDAAAGFYRVTDVTVSGLADPTCNSKNIDVTLKDVGNVSLGEGTAVIGVATTSVVVSITPNPEAEVVTGAAVVVYD